MEDEEEEVKKEKYVIFALHLKNSKKMQLNVEQLVNI